MRRTVPLSPSQSAAFAMGRVLILFDVFRLHSSAALDLERGMLLDFASQHPLPLANENAELRRALRAHRLHREDLSDLFAARQFEVLRERFAAVIADLLSRGLLEETPPRNESGSAGYVLTERGAETANAFVTTLSHSYRAVDDAICATWHRTSVKDLTEIIRGALPREARRIAELAVPLPSWLGDE